MSVSYSISRLAGLLGGLLILGCVAIYWHVGEFGFVTFDDEHSILFNPHMGPLSLARGHWAFTDLDYARRYMPLGWLGFSAVFSFAGLEAGDYHRVLLGVHAIDSVLFFLVLLQFTVSPAGTDAQGREWRVLCAFLGAAFWAWHPLRVESVAWASGLLYAQAEFFLLVAILIFLRRPAGRVAPWAAVACYAASLLTYPLVIGFAPVFALLLRWRGVRWREALVRALPFVLLAGIALALNLFARVNADSTFQHAPTATEFPPAARLMQACYLWIYYLWKPFWPSGLTLLSPVLIDFDPWSFAFVGSAAGLALIGILCVSLRRLRATAAPFLGAHLCVLVPMLGMAEHPHFPSDRYAAFPQAILVTALVLGLVRLSSVNVRRGILAGALAGCGILAGLSRRQTEAWRDASTLFNHIARYLPAEKSPLMCFERPAVLLYRNGDPAGALALLDRGIASLPADHSLMAARDAMVREVAEHREQLAAMGAPPTTSLSVLGHQSLGIAAAREGDLSAALAHLRAARLGAPDFYEPAYNLALVWLRLGQTRAALSCYLWSEAHGGEHLSPEARGRVLGMIAGQFAAAGETRLAAAARARAVTATAGRALAQ